MYLIIKLHYVYIYGDQSWVVTYYMYSGLRNHIPKIKYL